MARAHNFIDRSGQKFNRLTILHIDEEKTKSSGKVYWHCQCDCGNTKSIVGSNVVNSHVQSCGCYHKQRIKETKSTHGMTESPTYSTWLSMKERCTNKNSPSYPHYGAKGVVVCERWLHSFKNFLEDMGERPEGMTLNRVGSVPIYSKETCEWATYSVQGYDQKMKPSNTSGKTGVSETKYGRWVAYIDCESRIHLGTYRTIEEAIKVREDAELEYYGWIKE